MTTGIKWFEASREFSPGTTEKIAYLVVGGRLVRFGGVKNPMCAYGRPWKEAREILEKRGWLVVQLEDLS